MNGTNSIKCIITLGWKGLPGTNTAAYWDHSKVMKKINCCEYSTRNIDMLSLWCHDIQHNDTRHKGLISDIQQNRTQHNNTVPLS